MYNYLKNQSDESDIPFDILFKIFDYSNINDCQIITDYKKIDILKLIINNFKNNFDNQESLKILLIKLFNISVCDADNILSYDNNSIKNIDMYNNLKRILFTHYIASEVTKEKFLKKLVFENSYDIKNENIIMTQRIETKLRSFFNEMTEDEIKIFCRYISGNTLLQSRYLIKFFKHNGNATYKFASSHTCFSSLDIFIFSEINNIQYLNNKDAFIEFYRDGIDSFTTG